MTRRSFVAAGSAGALLASAGCEKQGAAGAGVKRVASELRHRPLASLPSTELSWLRLHDHFIATVGPRAGEGSRLGPLYVLADATFSPRSRFPVHPHRDVEILSLVVDGELSHHGDQANDAVVRGREAQLISARDGIVHAEGNVTDVPTRMLQIWFAPDARGGTPLYRSRTLPPARGPGRHLVAGDEGMPLRTDAKVWWLDLGAQSETTLEVAPGRGGYLLALTGPVQLDAGDVQAKVATREGTEVRPGTFTVRAHAETAVLWIDVAV